MQQELMAVPSLHLERRVVSDLSHHCRIEDEDIHENTRS